MEFRQDFTGIDWQIDGEAEKQASSIPALTGDVIFYAAKEAIRNAARHGRGDDLGRALHLRIRAAWRDGLELQISDDGIGLEPKPEPLPTGGQGLSLHSTMMAVIGGLLTTDDKPGIGTTLTIYLPQSSWQTG
jgi:signal transduction histidine kinase